MAKILKNLVNNAQFAEIFPINTHKYSETTEDRHQIHQNIPHHLLRQQQLAKILPLQYFSAYGICTEANCYKYFSRGILYSLGE